MPQMWPFLPSELDVRQVGALDGLTDEQIAGLAPGPSDYVLHTRLRSGHAVTVGRERIVPLMQTRLRQLADEGADPILLLCTGQFQALQSDALLIEPDRLLVNVMRGLRPRRMGVLVPLSSQIAAAAEKWKAVKAETRFAAASPYGHPAEVVQATRPFQADWPDVIVMDCMGYTLAHKRAVVQATGKPVILAASLAARILGELVDPCHQFSHIEPLTGE